MTTNRVETRQNNYLAIIDFFSKGSSDQYKDYFKSLYPDGVTHGPWARDSLGELTTRVKLGLETKVLSFVVIF